MFIAPRFEQVLNLATARGADRSWRAGCRFAPPEAIEAGLARAAQRTTDAMRRGSG